MSRYILVLNMGMKSIRSIVYDVSGEKLATASLPIETYLDREKVTQDPEEWWRKAVSVIRNSVNDIETKNIAYLTVTASSSCLVCVDKHCNALEKCIMVSDRRAIAEADQIKGIRAFRDLYEKCGVSVDASLMLPKILWIKNNQREIFDRTYKFLSPDDFLNARLTGRYVTDFFNARKIYYDNNLGRYPEKLLRELGINAALLPEVLDMGEEIGCLTSAAAKDLGLSKAVKVILTTYDAICNFFGSGVLKEGEASDASGTVTALRALSFKKDLASSSHAFTLPYKKWNMNIIGGSNNLGGGLIEWVKQCYYLNESYPYEIMEKDAYDAQLGAGGLTFLPYLLGERMPVWNSDARGVFFGIERAHTRKEMTRAVFESTGFIDLDMVNAIEETGMKVESIRLSGGLARINLISQIKADVTGRDIIVLADFETTAAGAALLALVGTGEYQNVEEAAGAFVDIRMIIHPIHANHRKYMEIYKIYKETYHNLEELFTERVKIMNSIYPKHEIRIANM